MAYDLPQWENVAREAAAANRIPYPVFRALIMRESGGESTQQTFAGRNYAQGFTQLLPAAAAEVGVTDRLDPTQNLYGGAAYLRRQIDANGGSIYDGLRAYRMGPGAARANPDAGSTYANTVLRDAGLAPNAVAPGEGAAPVPGPGAGQGERTVSPAAGGSATVSSVGGSQVGLNVDTFMRFAIGLLGAGILGVAVYALTKGEIKKWRGKT